MASNQRIVFLVGEVDEDSVQNVVLRMLDFNSEDDSKPIYLYINSNGGNITHGLAVMDTINHIKAPVYTVCYGMAASMGAFLLCCGEKGHRYALPHARIMIHQPLIMLKEPLIGNHDMLKKKADGLTKNRETLETIIATNTGQSIEKVHNDCERDNWMSAEQALAYGLIDEIMTEQK